MMAGFDGVALRKERQVLFKFAQLIAFDVLSNNSVAVATVGL
jgi:hypothetical protein